MITMAIERTYIIPLRREWLKVPKYKRAKKAVAGLKTFLMRHMKQDDIKKIKLGEYLNKEIWKRGMKSPPHKVKVNVIKEDDGIVKAELFGKKYVEKKAPEKKEKPTGIAGKLQSALGTGERPKKEEEAEEKEEKPKHEKKAPEKKEEKKETKPADKPVKREEKKPEHKKPEHKSPAKEQPKTSQKR